MIQYILYIILIFVPIARGAVRIWAYGPVYILTLSMLIFWVMKMAREKEIRIRRTPIDIPIISFAFISLISIINSKYIYGSIMEIIKFVILALIFYIVVNFIKEEHKIKRILNIILCIGTGIALFGILQYLGVFLNTWWDDPKFISATYVNHNHFAGLMELVIPLSLGLTLSEKKKSKKSIYIYSFLILCVAFLLSMSRGAWLSLTFSMLIMAIIIFKKGRSRLIVFISALLLIVAGIFLLNAVDLDFLFRRISSYRELDFAGRIEIWKGTLLSIKDNWFLGSGVGTFIYNFPKYRTIGLTRLINYSHNDYLQVAFEMGLFALLLMISIIVKTIKKGLKTHSIARSSFKKWIPLSLVIGILSISIHGIADFNFYIPSNAILIAVFFGLVFNIYSRKETKGPELILKLRPISCKFFKPFLIIPVSVLIIFISTSLTAEIYSTASDKALAKNKLENAEYFAIRSEKLCPLNFSYPYKIASMYNSKFYSYYHNRKYIEKAEKKYRIALRLNPIDAWSWIGLADAYDKLFKDSDLDYKFAGFANASYKKALALDPLNSYYLKKYGGFLLNLGNTSLSSEMYKKASIIMSKSKGLSWIPLLFVDGKSYKDLADMAFSTRDIKKALLFYKMAEEFCENGDNRGIRLGQIRCYLRVSLLREALSRYKTIKFIRKDNSIFFASLGDYYLKRGYIDTARRFSKKAILADPENPESYDLAYKIMRSTGQYGYFKEKVSRILDFNNLVFSKEFQSYGFTAQFEINKKLYNNMTIDIDIVMPSGVYRFDIIARGEDALNIWPHMIVMFNKKSILDSYVNEASWKRYKGIIIVDNSMTNKFEFIYDNDYYDPNDNEDRNLYIDRIELSTLY